MVSQRAHRMKELSLKTRWIDGKPFVQDDRGLMVAVPAGGAPEEGEGEGGEGAGGSEGADDEDKTKEGASGSGDKDKDGDTVTRAEYEAALERMRAADRAKNQKDGELEELRQFKKEMEDKDRSETEKLQRDKDDAAQRAEESMGRAAAAEMKLAMILANGKRDQKFRDPEDILRWIDVSDVTDEDGKLDSKALEKALDDLAKSKDYLLAEASKDDEEDEDEEDEDKPGPSGTSQNKDRNKGKGIDKDALARKYPALRGR